MHEFLAAMSTKSEKKSWKLIKKSKKWVKNKIRIYEMTDLIDDTFEPDYGEETEGQGDKTPKVKSDEDEGEIQSDSKSDDGEIKSG